MSDGMASVALEVTNLWKIAVHEIRSNIIKVLP